MTPTDEKLAELYTLAEQEGFWIKEFEAEDAEFEGQHGFPRGVAACGMIVDLEVIAKHEDISVEEVLEKLLIGDCSTLSAPGTGDTRLDRVQDAISNAKDFRDYGTLPVTIEAREKLGVTSKGKEDENGA